jgi:ABC-type antimicrobial peptide transport system permease subunit
MQEKSTHAPPKLALKLFSWFCNSTYHTDIEGDLIEHFETNVEEKGLKRARILFFFDILLLFRPGIIRPLWHTNPFKYPTMLKHHFKISWRQLSRNKAYSLLNISGLAIGMAVVILISLWVWDELSYNKSHENYARIARVMQNNTFDGVIQTSWGASKQMAPELREKYGSNFKYVSSTSHFNGRTLIVKDKTIGRTGMFVEADVPEMLSLNILSGTSSGLEDPYNILISESTAKALFDDENPINQTIKLTTEDLLQVIGVYADLPDNSSFSRAHFFGSWKLFEQWQPDWVGWGNYWFRTYVQLADHVDLDKASVAIKDVKLNNVDEEDGSKLKPVVFLHPMSKWHLKSDFENGKVVGGRIQYVWLYGIIGLFVLLLACINFVNLSTARSEKRAKEIGVRKALGSFRYQLINQFFSEALLITGFAFFLSIFLVALLMPFFNEVSGKEINDWWSNPAFWLLGIGFTILTGILASTYPALYLSSFRPVKVLKGSIQTGKKASIPRKVLVTLQFIVSIALVIGTMVVFKQIQFAKNRPLGYDQSNLLSTYVSNKISEKYAVFREELLQTGVVEEVAKSETFITQTYINNNGLNWEGKDPSMNEQFSTLRISHEFGNAIGWEIVQGRDFSKDFASDSLGFVINEAAVEYLGFDDPIGKQIQWGENDTYHIIGVVKNMITQSPYRPVKQMIYFIDYDRSDVVTLKIKSDADMATALPKIETIFKEFDSVQSFKYQFMDENYSTKFRGEERIGKLAGFFTILALLISCLGLFGMIAFVAERRTKEIGIRKVLGASVFGLWQLLIKEFIVLVIIAGMIAIPLAYYYLSKWLDNYEYHVTISVWVFILALVAAILITLVTVSVHAVRAAMTNPVKSLRSD